MLKPVIIKIKDLNTQFKNKDITFPNWQRKDNWSKQYKQNLIESILKKRMITMLYFANMNDNTIILDGGHRIRAINEFIDNRFSITIRNRKVWYTKKNKNKINKINPPFLTEDELNLFDNYPLPLYIYKDIKEDESRDIFNELQHCRPMSTAEMCNSYESKLVDYLRNLKKLQITDDKTFYEILESSKNNLKKPKKNNFLVTTIQLFSIYNLVNSKVLKPEATLLPLSYTPLMCLNFLKKYKQEGLNDVNKKEFEEKLTFFLNVVCKIEKKIKIAYYYSIFHYICWHNVNKSSNEFYNKIKDFVYGENNSEESKKWKNSVDRTKKEIYKAGYLTRYNILSTCKYTMNKIEDIKTEDMKIITEVSS